MLLFDNRSIRRGIFHLRSSRIARACFKSWAGDETNFEKDVIEACLTHVISDKLEAAYRRSDFYSKRTNLMAAWADFVEGKVTMPEDKSAPPDASPPGEAFSPNAAQDTVR
jgi:hypothetical protein